MAAPILSRTLPRSRRLQTPGEFARVRKAGQRLILGCLILNWKPASATRLGVITSRKIGGAVVRNRARRLMRECFRQRQAELLQPVELILVARNSISGRTMADVEFDFLKALKRAGLIKAAEQ